MRFYLWNSCVPNSCLLPPTLCSILVKKKLSMNTKKKFIFFYHASCSNVHTIIFRYKISIPEQNKENNFQTIFRFLTFFKRFKTIIKPWQLAHQFSIEFLKGRTKKNCSQQKWKKNNKTNWIKNFSNKSSI